MISQCTCEPREFLPWERSTRSRLSLDGTGSLEPKLCERGHTPSVGGWAATPIRHLDGSTSSRSRQPQAHSWRVRHGRHHVRLCGRPQFPLLDLPVEVDELVCGVDQRAASSFECGGGADRLPADPVRSKAVQQMAAEERVNGFPARLGGSSSARTWPRASPRKPRGGVRPWRDRDPETEAG